jgi:hypothetical protein
MMKSAIWQGRNRWSDDDHYFGPFLYARDGRGYSPFSLMLDSGDGEDSPGCSFRIRGFGHTLMVALPQWCLQPFRRKVIAHWDAATIARLGRDWYWDIDAREYGFTLSEGHLSVHLGRQTMDSSTEQQWGCFLPWTQWRSVRHSLYDLKGVHFYTMRERGRHLGDGAWHNHWAAEKAIEAACPAAIFAFDDFDGERLTATTRIEERESLFGTGWFKWLSLFLAAKIYRSLDISFSGETGKRKGSWKGGTVGHSIQMLDRDESHEEAFRRYCAEHQMTFVGDVTPQPTPGPGDEKATTAA